MFSRFTRYVRVSTLTQTRNYFSKGGYSYNPGYRLAFGLSVGLIGASAGFISYAKLKESSRHLLFRTIQCESKISQVQPSVYSGTKQHALYLTIRLKLGTDLKDCAKKLANLQSLVDQVVDPNLADEEDEMLAGVGFSPRFLAKVGHKAPENFEYTTKSGKLGSMPQSHGDIFVHAKCNNYGSLFELTQRILNSLSPGAIESFDDIYGFVYRNGRDLSGFIDGTENPASEDDRKKIAVNSSTNGSFVITQKWLHNHDVIKSSKDETLESFVGRKITDSTELKNKLASSHVARMTGGTGFEQKKKFEIVRQSQPYGTVTGENGLFFIAYSASPNAFEWMLNRMVGADTDRLHDDIMQLSKCLASTYWYFPSADELSKMAN